MERLLGHAGMAVLYLGAGLGGGLALATHGQAQGGFRMATNGTDYLLVFLDDRSRADISVTGRTDMNWDLYRARVVPGTDGGAPTCTVGPVATSSYAEMTTAIDWDGNGYRVVFGQYAGSHDPASSTTKTMRLDVGGQPAGAAATIATAGVSVPELLWNGTNHVLVSGGTKPSARLLSATGAMMGSSVEIGQNPATAVKAALAGADVLAVWTEGTTNNTVVRGNVIASSGQPIAATTLAFGGAAGSTGQLDGVPAVASDGTSFVVVWREQQSATAAPSVRAAHVTKSGVITPIPQALGSGDVPTIAWTGAAYVVFWTRPGTATDLRGTVLTAEGEPQVDHELWIPPLTARPTSVDLKWGSAVSGLLAYTRTDSVTAAARIFVRHILLTTTRPLIPPEPSVDAGAMADASPLVGDAGKPLADSSAGIDAVADTRAFAETGQPHVDGGPDAVDSGTSADAATSSRDAASVDGNTSRDAASVDGNTSRDAVGADGNTMAGDVSAPPGDTGRDGPASPDLGGADRSGGGSKRTSGGCTCASAGSPSAGDGAATLLLAGLLLVRRRRRPPTSFDTRS